MIIGGSRGCGKTTRLVKVSHNEKTPIVCASKERAKFVERIAEDLGYLIPKPISVESFPLFGIRLEEVLVDDIEDVLSFVLKTKVSHSSSSEELRVLPINKNIAQKFIY